MSNEKKYLIILKDRKATPAATGLTQKTLKKVTTSTLSSLGNPTAWDLIIGAAIAVMEKAKAALTIRS